MSVLQRAAARIKETVSARSDGTRWATALALLLIVLLGGALRFRGLDWDRPPGGSSAHLHPDERFLAIVADGLDWPSSLSNYLDTNGSPLNPYNLPQVHSFVYGTLPLYLGKGLATIAGDDPAGPGNSYDTSLLWGRRLTAAVSTASIIVLFLLGTALFGRGVALLAALLYALSVLPTQLAHFWTVDPYVTFFGLVTMLLSVLAARERSSARMWALHAGIGVAIGLGMASKVAFWPLILAPVLETAARIAARDLPLASRGRRGPPGRSAGNWMSDVGALFLAGFVSLLVFRLAQPIAFSGPGLLDLQVNLRWWDDLRAEGQRQSGNSGLPWVTQFAGRPPYLESLKNMILWGMGPALGLTAWISLAAAALASLRRYDRSLLLPVLLPLVFVAYFGGRFVVFMRYFDPVYPLLALMAAWGLSRLFRLGRDAGAARRLLPGGPGAWMTLQTPLRVIAVTAPVAVVAATLWWALAFQNVYAQEHPRIAASRWIYDNVPEGASISYELWDDSLPLSLPAGRSPMDYDLVPTDPYEPDSLEKVRKLVYGDPAVPERKGLAGVDYVVLSSDRIRLSVPRLERKYPATIRYYELLDSGELGFELVAVFRTRPSFLGLSIDDSGAEESFSVYDHPTVRIYRKTGAWDAARALDLLLAAHPERAVNLRPGQGRTNGLQFTAAEAAAQQAGGSFASLFDPGSASSKWPALWWFLWLQLAAYAALPFSVVFFRRLPDRGFPLTKLLGPLLVALAVWLLVAWGFFDFSAGLARAVFVIWMAAGVIGALVYRDLLRSSARKLWRRWAVAEVLFILVFLAFLGLRILNPDTWHHPQGGEKPMELAYLTAVVRSTHMPPYDPWFAGGSMNYYYWGWFFLAVPIRALRILPEVAFNLGVPTFAALASSVAFSTAGNLASLSSASARVGRRWSAAVAAGLLGAFLLTFSGNLDGAHQTVERLQRMSRLSLFDGVPVLGGLIDLAGGVAAFVGGRNLPPYDWWRSSRVHIGSFDITEFPYWSFTFSDLHPHLMGLPFLGLVAALALACLLAARAGDRSRTLATAALLGLAVALVRAVHTWDLPTAMLLAVAAIVGGQLLATDPWPRRGRLLLLQLGTFALFLIVPLEPYTQHTEVFNRGLEWAPERTPVYQFFAQFGVFLIVALAYTAVAYAMTRRAASGPRRTTVLPFLPGWRSGVALMAVAGLVAAITFGADYTTVALSALFEVVLFNLLLAQWQGSPRDLGAVVATSLFAVGLAIAAGVDVVTVEGDIVRMNTVFKFSLQAWQLLAIASGFGLWYVLVALPQLVPAKQAAARNLAAAAGAVLLAVSAIYLVSGTPARLAARFPTTYRGLDGLAYVRTAVFPEDAGTADPGDDRELKLADDLPLIEWLRANVQGSPVIVEAVGPLYHWTGRISMYTGLPAVIGWDWHQIQQRGPYAGLVQQRRVATQQFYREAAIASAEAYLRKYNVSYVVVGTEELVFGTPAGLARLDRIPALREVFRNGPYAIYEVDQAALPAPIP